MIFYKGKCETCGSYSEELMEIEGENKVAMRDYFLMCDECCRKAEQERQADLQAKAEFDAELMDEQ